MADDRPKPLIVYVDDEAANRLVFEQGFEGEFAVRCAPDGATALALMAEHDVAVLVTDMRMPGMTGEELLRIVKERCPATIRMVITAYSDVDPILRAINEGLVARYIIKPWEQPELVQVLRWATEAWAFTRDSAALHHRLLETERLVTLGTMVGAIAHDLNQPLQALVLDSTEIVALAEVVPHIRDALVGRYVSLKDHERIAYTLANLQSHAADLERSVLYVRSLVQRMQQYAKSGPGAVAANAATDPLPIVRHAMAVCESIASRSRCTIRYDGPAELPQVRIQATELTQVLINLIANAARAVAERGGHIQIHARTDNGNLEVQVTDDGVGMPADVLARVGTPFFTTRVDGTGLGLAQCQRLIGTAGGRFRIESTEGVGTTVTITLPLAA